MLWEYRSNSGETAMALAKEFNVSEFMMTLLLNRGIDTADKIKKFINPQLSSFRDPFLFENMEKVVQKIIEIKNKNGKIFIYGDYDVDGITSAVFLTKVFAQIGIDVEYYIPNRMEEGYGLDRKNLEYMRNKGAELVITVDTSISSIEDIRYGRSLGMDVIITDHHKSAKEKEDDEILYINPKLSENYTFKSLAGAGVALKVAQALYITLGIDLSEVYKFLDIVMIGTVADVVPIVDENRIIIKEGLKKLKNTEVKGLVSIMKYLKLNNKNISTTDISYFISPLINSLGRIGISKIGADFFIETDELKIYDIIEEMKKSNKKRREVEKDIYDDAIKLIETDKEKMKNGIFLASKSWHPGVIGIVSSRLSIKYGVPVILISVSENVGKASSRSVNGINIFNIFKKMSYLLIRFGGHDLAAGFIANEKNLKEIEEIFYEEVRKPSEIKEARKLKVDMELPIEKIDSKMLDDLESLSPFGIENNIPLFVDRNLNFNEIKKFGVDNKHFSGYIEKNEKKYSMVGFDMAKHVSDIGYKIQKFDIVYYPERSYFRGVESVQIKIKDIQIKDDFYDLFSLEKK
ncbi:MAG: single-stranded-DNA-specific exonuclease RecJ [Fusobacteriaceae bacterium]